MAAPAHNFRYIVKPGTDFSFTAKFRIWILLSGLLITASIASLFVNKAVRGQYLNWSIDFKGGTEVVYAFVDKAKPDTFVHADPGKVRAALSGAGIEGFDVSEMTWKDDKKREVRGALVRTPYFGATKPAQQQAVIDALSAQFADREIDNLQWSGDRLLVRSRKHLTDAEVAPVFAAQQLEVKPWGDAAKFYNQPDEGSGEYKQTFSIYGLDRQYEQVLEKALPDIDVVTIQSSNVSAKAGAELRNGGIKALFYAMLLITLYLAVRFDIRYAPGAIVATFHDAIMVIGVFSVTWTDVSLTSVAALLTVVGFSVNDTVVIFDRIRENQEKLKDKKLDRIVDISLNEVVVRSILTSLTVFSVTFIMNVFGTGLVRNFAFAMNAGIITGAYSSIFLAPPIFLWISKRFYGGTRPARAV
ncbi:MAG: protein translocase subunit SecF [Kofleriaceae bacterium]|nr:protein translocase subunit SecF [Kofleriaceae bacterium]MBP9169174.1 protein translocase subunit SecF [Kofleriaceae bacterium]MBP9857867.1 protein translocase subunit SecF [Kofleriaceae bacterium]